jgi:hypothetical protein
VTGVVVDDPPEEHAEEHAQPDEAGDHWEDPIRYDASDSHFKGCVDNQV